MQASDLIAFEQMVAEEFNAGNIRAPIHLSGGNEEELIEIFKGIRPQDWIACSWRSHYHCLLKGVPPDELKAEIMAGRSMTLCFPEHRIISSAIVGGILPIATGIAMGIKRRGEDAKVWAFVGDMTAMGGMMHECQTYAFNHELPITFVIEDNHLSVCTDTREVWNAGPFSKFFSRIYRYKLTWPHAGAGKRVQF